MSGDGVDTGGEARVDVLEPGSTRRRRIPRGRLAPLLLGHHGYTALPPRVWSRTTFPQKNAR
eukprot:6044814-Pyramimonas_sp.AAC.1